MKRDGWEFWIDVGGTFTDCCARAADGKFLQHKVLSSGVTKGAVGAGSSSFTIIDAARKVDPAGFWRGARLTLFTPTGETLGESVVTEFDANVGALVLQTPLEVSAELGQFYELSTDEEAPVLAVRYLLGLPLSSPLPAVSVRLGTTRGTNALITRRGARVAFITTRGFGDILHIGYQNRPKLFELNIQKPRPLFCSIVEIDERVSASGEVLRSPNSEEIRRQLFQLQSEKVDSLAICLVHGSEFPAHERLVAEIARQIGFEEISISHQVMPVVKIVARGDTTVVDAYLNPVLRRYTAKLKHSLPGSDLRIMTSAGSLAQSESFSGKDSILSGPAAGVVGFLRVAQAAGFSRAIGFDMGGTSTDVSRFDGRYEFQYETEKSGVRIVAPMLAIETVAAGGGSICAFDGIKLIVGPDSAGADPGPACYGRGGPLTLTDVNFYLGKIPADRFPFPLIRSAVELRLKALAAEIYNVTGGRFSDVELAEKFLQVANASMVKAIRSISIAKGCDPREYILVPFGGAAGQHACAVAQELGIRQILHHPHAGLLSAMGIGLANHAQHRVASIYRPYSTQLVAELSTEFQRMAADAIEQLQDELPSEAVSVVPSDCQRNDAGRLEIHRRLDLRYQGLDASLTIDEPADGDYPVAFTTEHQKLYGYAQPSRTIEIAAARVEVVWRTRQSVGRTGRVSIPDDQRLPRVANFAEIYFHGRRHKTRIFDRSELRPGQLIAGPAIVLEVGSTTVIDPGWAGEVLSGGEILIERHTVDGGTSDAAASDTMACDPALLEIFNHQFAAIAEQMGITLRNTASSINVKERLDFSCAIFTPRGELVVNAPHIPVHLGAMGETVRRIVAENPSLGAGDVFVTNDPYRGGSHLPDITVVTPVFSAEQKVVCQSERSTGEMLFFTASRAHHAEIGGIVPGSMPPHSTNLAEEGVLIRNFKLLDQGIERFDQLRSLLLSAPYPSRAVDENLADIAAQVAANNQGARELCALIKRHTLPVVHAYMQFIRSAAELKTRRALARFPSGRREFIDHLDDGTPIRAAISIHSTRTVSSPHPSTKAITIDFSGTGPVHRGNLNANRAIVTAAVMYVLRLLIDEDIPLNEGVLAPVELVLPECILNPPNRDSPAQCAAMAGGNVETSQRVVDVLLGAFGIAAASQGTMNNLLFGNDRFGYYETICGGSGATAQCRGADAVHTHMTNTRITDPEVLERRFPVRVCEFSIRRGSGGSGQNPGGHGVRRVLEFSEPLQVSILSQRRGPYPPYGMSGGSAGAFGQQFVKARKRSN